MKAIVSLIAALIISTVSLSAQDMFVSSGSVGVSGKASLCYVIGGIVVNEAAPLTPVIHSKLKKLGMTTSVETTKNDVTLNIYPNPTSDFVNIRLNDSFSGTGKVTIFDMSSSIVNSENILNQNARVDVSNLIAGVYLVKVEDSMGQFSEVKRIVKN